MTNLNSNHWHSCAESRRDILERSKIVKTESLTLNKRRLLARIQVAATLPHVRKSGIERSNGKDKPSPSSTLILAIAGETPSGINSSDRKIVTIEPVSGS